MKQYLFLFFLLFCFACEEKTTKLEANFTFTMAGDGKVQFTCNSSNLNYSWDFGDGNKSTEQNPANSYLKNGSYDVTLVISDKNSQASKKQTIVITDAPKPDGKFSFTNLGNGKVIFKTDAQRVDSYLWEFGDGESSTEKEVEHFYKLNGTYKVKLTLINSNGKTEIAQEININDAPKPLIKFLYNNLGNGKISFVNESENADSYKWDFGDGATSIEKNPQHYYTLNGTYKVKLTGKNINGETELIKEVKIDNAPKPTAKFSFNNIGNGKISFSNESGNADSYHWDFGDGATSTEKNPQYSYLKNGDYKVKLTATNKNGATEYQQTITISNIIITYDHVIENQSNYTVIVYNDDKNNKTQNFPETTIPAKSKVTIKLNTTESITIFVKSNDNSLQLEYSTNNNRNYVIEAYKFLFEVKFSGDCKPIKINYTSDENIVTLTDIALSFILQINNYNLDIFEVQGFKNNVNGTLKIELKYKDKVVVTDNIATPHGDIKIRFNTKSKKIDIVKFNPEEWPCGFYNGNRLRTGPKGGCYYINSNNNKTYVDRSFCNCD